MMNVDRRSFLKIVGAGGVVLYLQPTGAFAGATGADPSIDRISPIDRSLPDVAPRQYFGDDPQKAHKVLWNKEAMSAALAGQVSKPAEVTNLVIIGGGISGLMTAYLLREHKPIILEQDPRFGGNAKGQGWRGIDYAIGAAYVVEPEEDTDIGKLFAELGLKDKLVTKEGEDPVAIGTKIFKEFWSGESVGEDSAAKEQFTKLSGYFKKIFDEEEAPYPDIPVTDPEQRSRIDELDKISFRDHILKIAETEKLHPHIETALEHYCWSSFGSAFGEISAAAGLNFYAAEFGNLNVYPGGNACIAERLLSKVAGALPAANLRTSSLAYDVTVKNDKVQVRYLDRRGGMQTIVAKAAVMACPKFVVGKIMPEIEPERLDAIKKLRYHSYLVANVLLKGAPPEAFYDLYMLGDGTVDSKNLIAETARKGVTDVILGNFATPGKDSTVLTLYRGLPYDGARGELYVPDSYDKYRKAFEEQVKNQILPLLKLNPDSIVDLRVARWGHPLPVAAPGLIADKVVDKLRAPYKERVFFVEQDNWALPAFETSVTEAYTFAPQIKKFL